MKASIYFYNDREVVPSTGSGTEDTSVVELVETTDTRHRNKT